MDQPKPDAPAAAPPLIQCDHCRRHYKSGEVGCPFCARRRRTIIAAGLVVASAATALAVYEMQPEDVQRAKELMKVVPERKTSDSSVHRNITSFYGSKSTATE